jgi:hypothetical protein
MERVRTDPQDTLAWLKEKGQFLAWGIALVLATFYWCRFRGPGWTGKLLLAFALIALALAIGAVFLKPIRGWLREHSPFLAWGMALVLGSFYWCRSVGPGDHEKMRLVLALMALAFAVGVILLPTGSLGWLKKNGQFVSWIVVLVPGSYYWCRFVGQGDNEKMRLVLALIALAFAVGAIFGFLFTSYGEDEKTTIGKVRDWLIGGIVGLGLSQAIEQGGTLKKILQKFQFSQSDNDFALVIGTAVAYVTLGFFFMFFQRELILNVELASRRAERGRIDGTHQAGLVIQRTLAVLPASLLSGVDDIEQISQLAPDEAAHLREILYAPDVETFLSQAAAASRDGLTLDWDIISKAAYIHYYRTYFEKEDKAAQIQRAMEWLLKALLITPLHADFTMKYADMLMSDSEKDYLGAATILERLAQRQNSPLLVRQWLGYVLLFIPERVEEAIHYSDWFHKEFPDDPGSLFNMACGYGQLYCRSKRLGHPDEKLRTEALADLRASLRIAPGYVDKAADALTKPGEDFECFAEDLGFVELINEVKRKPAAGDAGEKKDS